MKVVLIDHHDSFAWNLAHLFGAAIGALPDVVQSDSLDIAALVASRPDLVLLGPGPGHPADPAAAGRSLAVISALRGQVPLFGVCLGLQLLVVAAGGRVVRAAAPMHGKQSAVAHSGHSLFAGLDNPVAMMRYHSLVAERESLPSALEVIATAPGGEVMAIADEAGRACAVQFHPESVGSRGGPLDRSVNRSADGMADGDRLAANVLEWARRCTGERDRR